jgi:hypothetical protein
MKRARAACGVGRELLAGDATHRRSTRDRAVSHGTGAIERREPNGRLQNQSNRRPIGRPCQTAADSEVSLNLCNRPRRRPVLSHSSRKNRCGKRERERQSTRELKAPFFGYFAACTSPELLSCCVRARTSRPAPSPIEERSISATPNLHCVHWATRMPLTLRLRTAKKHADIYPLRAFLKATTPTSAPSTPNGRPR